MNASTIKTVDRTERKRLMGLLREPAAARYQDGMNLYEFVRSDPTTQVDPDGTDTWSPLPGLNPGNYPSGWPTNTPPAKPPAPPSTQPSNPNPPKHVVKIVTCYIKGNPIFGVAPVHQYIMIDGVGYGKYANSHAGGQPDSSGGAGVILTNGTVRDGDETLYPPTTNPASVPDGKPYGIPQDPEHPLDVERLLAAIKKDLGRRDLTYGAGTKDCFGYCTERLIDAQDWSKMSTKDILLGNFYGANSMPE